VYFDSHPCGYNISINRHIAGHDCVRTSRFLFSLIFSFEIQGSRSSFAARPSELASVVVGPEFPN